MAIGAAKVALLENGSATGDAKNWPGGVGIFTAVATWGGGTVKLQMKLPDSGSGTWVDVASASMTADGYKTFDLPPCELKAHVATATAVYAYVVKARD